MPQTRRIHIWRRAHQASIYANTKVEIVEYAGQTYSAEARVAMSKREGQEAKFRNTHVPGADTVAENEITKIHARTALMKFIKYTDDMEKLYIVIYGKCLDAMRQQLDTQENFETHQMTTIQSHWWWWSSRYDLSTKQISMIL